MMEIARRNDENLQSCINCVNNNFIPHNENQTMKIFKGENIKEVWDYRLSTAVPLITRTSGTWVVEIWAKENTPFTGDPATLAKPLETFDTGIKAEPNDEHDTTKVTTCYEFLYKVRDQYALPNIEEMKPLVAKINAANIALAQLGEKK